MDYEEAIRIRSGDGKAVALGKLAKEAMHHVSRAKEAISLQKDGLEGSVREYLKEYRIDYATMPLARARNTLGTIALANAIAVYDHLGLYMKGISELGESDIYAIPDERIGFFLQADTDMHHLTNALEGIASLGVSNAKLMPMPDYSWVTIPHWGTKERQYSEDTAGFTAYFASAEKELAKAVQRNVPGSSDTWLDFLTKKRPLLLGVLYLAPEVERQNPKVVMPEY
ncbi:MAG: hypothetical protein HGA85_01895 [Nanoarchaeota archaeon]|nr:hypothetical protein [Nanoarchaeota archaeon]